jgi:uncharacterized membrane protein
MDQDTKQGLDIGDGLRFGFGFAAGLTAFWLLVAVALTIAFSLVGHSS